MSDNQRVSGWSVLCFRTPTITTPVRRCIKPQTAGAFLFFFLRFPKKLRHQTNRLRILFKHWIRSFFFKITSGIVQGRFGSALGKQHENRKKTTRTITEWSPLLSWPSIQPVICKLQTKSGISPKNTDIWTISWATPSHPGGYLTPRKGCLNPPENCFVVIFCWNIQQKTHICTYLVKLCQTIKYWNNVISVFGGFRCLDQ